MIDYPRQELITFAGRGCPYFPYVSGLFILVCI